MTSMAQRTTPPRRISSCRNSPSSSQRSAFAPLQLLTQHVEEAIRMEAHQLHGKVRAAASQFIADPELDGFLPVHGKERLVRHAFKVNLNTRRAGNDHGAQGELVRAD